MGAMAISTLAGTRIILIANESPLLSSLLPFLKGVTLLFWTAGTWWVPFLILLEIWCYIYKRYPIKYSPMYWGLIFPLGMYTASTFELIQVFDLDFLATIPHVFLCLALLCWSIACCGVIHKAWKFFARPV